MFVAYPLCKLRQRADFLLLVCFTLLCGKTTPLGIKLPIIRGGHTLCCASWNKGLDRAFFIHVWRIAEKNDHHIPDSRKPRRGINAWFIERNRRRILPGHPPGTPGLNWTGLNSCTFVKLKKGQCARGDDSNLAKLNQPIDRNPRVLIQSIGFYFASA